MEVEKSLFQHLGNPLTHLTVEDSQHHVLYPSRFLIVPLPPLLSLPSLTPSLPSPSSIVINFMISLQSDPQHCVQSQRAQSPSGYRLPGRGGCCSCPTASHPEEQTGCGGDQSLAQVQQLSAREAEQGGHSYSSCQVGLTPNHNN